MSVEKVIEATGLRRVYGEVTALNDLTLEVRAGEVFGLLGPNGAGKTTTVKVLITLERAQGGHAKVLGHDVEKEPDKVRAAIGYVPQELSSDKYLTARENLEFFCDLYHLSAAAKKTRIAALLALLGLEEAADRQLRTFSGGMKKKLDLACGLVHEPRLLFLDEPSLGLDVAIRRAVWDHILELKQRGTAVFLCTNDMDEADKLCDRVAIVERGRIVACGTPRDLRAELGGDVVTIGCAEEAGLDPAERAVRKLAFVKDALREGKRLHVTVEANETALPALLAAMSAAGAAAESVSYHRPGLEEVFLHHTGKRYADAQGTSGPPKRVRA